LAEGFFGRFYCHWFLAYFVDITDRLGYTRPLLSAMPLEQVYDKTFVNEHVPLDGYVYHHCKFINVTFVINGRLPGGIHESEIGHFWITSTDLSVQSVLAGLNAFGFLKVSLVQDGKIVAPFEANNTVAPWVNPELERK
jgi:hypothetical protein